MHVSAEQCSSSEIPVGFRLKACMDDNGKLQDNMSSVIYMDALANREGYLKVFSCSVMLQRLEEVWWLLHMFQKKHVPAHS